MLLACMFPMCGGMLCMHVLCVPTYSAHAYANLCTRVLSVCAVCVHMCVPLDTCSLGLCVHKYVRTVYCSDAVRMEFVWQSLCTCAYICVCVCARVCMRVQGSSWCWAWQGLAQQGTAGWTRLAVHKVDTISQRLWVN